MRIAVGGIHTESSTFNPLTTTLADFRVLRGDALLRDAGFRALDALRGAEVVGTLYARALPGGPVDPDAYHALKHEFLERLRAALPVDGVWLAMHGAVHVRGMDDAEADWIGAVREVVGHEALLVASYDLHGNLSERAAGMLDGLSAFRTAPHVDVMATHVRALALLRRGLEGGQRPLLRRVAIPLLLPGERTSTEDEPARGLYAGLAAFDARPGVWDASLLVGYVWADEPRACASAVVTGVDPEAVDRSAREVARGYWDARHRFVFGSRHGTLDAMIEAALAEVPTPGSGTLAIVADSGDNPTAGGAGDRADALAALLAREAQDVLVAGIAAPRATAACFEAGEGAAIEVEVGAQLAPGSGPVVRFAGEVLRLAGAEDARERSAVVRSGGVTVVLGARRRPYHERGDFDALGTPLAHYRVLVVKSGYLAPELAPLANPSLLALSPGAVDQDIVSLGHRRVPRPFFPRDPEMNWSPEQSGDGADASGRVP
jgi:microcystin degradation protein MlrC